MNTVVDNLTPIGVQSKETMALAAAKAMDASDTVRDTAVDVADTVTDGVDEIAGRARHGVKAATRGAEDLADKAHERFDAARRQTLDSVGNLSQQVADYAAAEPVKTMLMAAAAGAMLMAIVSLLSGSRD